MKTSTVRRRHSAFAASLATLAMALGFTAIPAEAAPAPQVDYVALGDSYTAGTGAGLAERPPGEDCWQSSGGYVDAVGKTGRVDLVDNAACHGAVLSMKSRFYDHAIITPTVKQQLLSLAESGSLSPDTELVSITAGANDLGFAYVLGACSTSTQAACSATLGELASPAALDFLRTSLARTYAAIKNVAPNARIAVLGYPLLFDPASPLAPLPVENQVLINQATLLVNATIAAAVETANTVYGTNAQYVDVTAIFAGHAANSPVPWLQLKTQDPFADYNFHPNKEGHRAYASALLEAVKPAQLATK